MKSTVLAAGLTILARGVQSKGPWDYLMLLETIPGDEADIPVTDGGCPLGQ